MKYELEQSLNFDKWLKRIKDIKAKVNILNRLNMISELGNFGDHKSVGGKVSELRINVGKGYRVYYTLKGTAVVFFIDWRCKRYSVKRH